jgi:LmbE family N-acetylglucosaminyl deacetylase
MRCSRAREPDAMLGDAKKILLLSPHADDIEIGAGGTVARLLEEGHRIRWVVVAAPEEKRAREQAEVLDQLGVAERELLGFRDRFLGEDRQAILDRLEAIRDDFAPDLVIGPSHDLHQDHRTVRDEMLRAFKTCASILSYEPWVTESFRPSLYVRLSEAHLAAKRAMVERYVTQEKKIYTDFRYLQGRALLRGAECDAPYAEAFEVLRWML